MSKTLPAVDVVIVGAGWTGSVIGNWNLILQLVHQYFP